MDWISIASAERSQARGCRFAPVLRNPSFCCSRPTTLQPNDRLGWVADNHPVALRLSGGLCGRLWGFCLGFSFFSVVCSVLEFVSVGWYENPCGGRFYDHRIATSPCSVVALVTRLEAISRAFMRRLRSWRSTGLMHRGSRVPRESEARGDLSLIMSKGLPLEYHVRDRSWPPTSEFALSSVGRCLRIFAPRHRGFAARWHLG